MVIDIRAWLKNRNVMCGIFGFFVLSATYLQIAEILDITEEQVKVNLFRGRQKIKQKYLEIQNYGL